MGRRKGCHLYAFIPPPRSRLSFGFFSGAEESGSKVGRLEEKPGGQADPDQGEDEQRTDPEAVRGEGVILLPYPPEPIKGSLTPSRWTAIKPRIPMTNR